MGFLTWVRVQWDRAGAVALAAAGLVALLLGWLGASDSPHLAVQIPYFISGGLTGIFLIGAAAALWLSADMRDEWRELRRLRVLLEDEAEVASRALSAGSGGTQSERPRTGEHARRVDLDAAPEHTVGSAR